MNTARRKPCLVWAEDNCGSGEERARNKKHFAIPASLLVTGAIFGAATKAAASISDLADKMLDDFNYLIYLLPLALVIPILAKNIVERQPQKSPR